MLNELILKEKSELAKRVLEHDTPYSRSKITIHKFFDNGNDAISPEIVDKQLTIIDSYYSTNMSRRYYGIEEVAESIVEIATNKKDLKRIFIEYTKNPHNLENVTSLFNSQYGYNKVGKRFGQATSLISKYAYFITDFNFPIYDSIVREVYPLITGAKLVDNKFDDFINSMNALLTSSNIDNYNQLDNLLWLIGKINRGNYSLILKKDKYLKLVGKIESFAGLESIDIDKKIKEFIYQNIESLFELFTNDQIEMIKYCKSLTVK
jgi:hypothetical protein